MIFGTFVIVAVLVFVVLFLVRRTTLSGDVDRALAELHRHATTVAAFASFHFQHTFRPLIMRLGWLVVAVFVMMFFGTIAMSMFGSTPALTLCVTLPCAVISALLVASVTVSLRPSILVLLATSSVSLCVSGFAMVFAGVFAHDMSLTILGTMAVLLGISLVHAFCRLLAMFGMKVVDAGEGALASTMRVGRAVASATSIRGLDTLLAGQVPAGPNFFNQEEFVPAVDAFFRNVFRSIAPFLILSIAVHHEAVLLIAAGLAVMFRLTWAQLEANGVNTAVRRMRSALLLELVVYVSSAVLIVKAVRPFLSDGINAALNTLLANTFVKLIQNLLVGLAAGIGWLADVLSRAYMPVVIAAIAAIFFAGWLSRRGTGGRILGLLPLFIAGMAVLALLAVLLPVSITEFRTLKSEVQHAMVVPLQQPVATPTSPATATSSEEAKQEPVATSAPVTPTPASTGVSPDPVAEAEAARARAYADEVIASSAPMTQEEIDAALASRHKATGTKKRSSAARSTASFASASDAVAVNLADNPDLTALCRKYPKSCPK